MPGRKALVGSIAAGSGLIIAALSLALAGLGGANVPEQASPRSSFSLEQARAFQDFPVYNAGDSVDGLPLVAVLRRNDTAKYISFIYGSCVVTADTGCAPPAEVQVWPACVRHLALYDPSIPGAPDPEPTSIRGTTAAFLDDGLHLEIHTGRSMIVIFADSQERVVRIANALRGVNVATPADVPLPAPAPGAAEGKLRC